MGFTTDLAVVRAAAADDLNHPSELGGTPLTDAETAEVIRRMTVQWATGPALEYATAEPEFAGSFIDQRGGGVPVFLFTNSLDTHRESIVKALEEPIEFRVERVARSLDELLAQQAAILAQIDSLAAAGANVVETAILPDRNAVLVGLDGLTPARAGDVTESAGPGLVFEEAKAAHADACLNGSNCRPIKGGIAITRPNGSWPCTSGFVVKEGGTVRLLTAGHCLHMAGGPTLDWTHNSIKFGDALSDTWQPGYTRTADVGLIDIDSGEQSQMVGDNQMHRGAGNVYGVVGKVNGASQSQGTLVYRYGRTSGTDHGLINGLYASRQSCVDVTPPKCMTVTQTIRVDFDSTGGDSGGPVFYYVTFPGGSTGVVAMGTHVHSEDETEDPYPWYGWYSPVDVGAAQYDEFWGLYTLCTQNVC